MVEPSGAPHRLHHRAVRQVRKKARSAQRSFTIGRHVALWIENFGFGLNCLLHRCCGRFWERKIRAAALATTDRIILILTTAVSAGFHRI
jgi:hypothetical protein